MKKTMILVSIAGSLAIAVSLSAQEEETSVQAGVYSQEQAERGGEIFGIACLVCHQPEEFAAGGYMHGWTGMNVNDLVEFIRSTMPEDNPGRLKRQEYIDIVAFLLKQNGLPAGETEMVRATLKKIQIEGPYGDSGEE